MTSKQNKIKIIAQTYADTYKALSNIAILGISTNNFNIIQRDYDILLKLRHRIKNFIKNTCSDTDIKNHTDSTFDNLPEYLSPLKTVHIYNKILALKYTEQDFTNIYEYITVNKMSIELNSEEEIPYINILNALYKNKKYPEIIELSKLMLKTSDTAPMWEILGKTYRDTGRYGEAIKAYKHYLKLNENDETAQEDLNKIYEEAFK